MTGQRVSSRCSASCHTTKISTPFIVHICKYHFNPYPAEFFFPEYFICFLSVAFTQVKFRLDFFIMEANTMNPDQTAPMGAV